MRFPLSFARAFTHPTHRSTGCHSDVRRNLEDQTSPRFLPSVEKTSGKPLRRIVSCASVAFAFLLLSYGCSQEPAVEKEVLAPVAKPAPKAPAEPDAGLVGSSHQQEAALDQAMKIAEDTATEAVAETQAAATGAVEVPAGYRLTHVTAQGGMPSIDLLVPEKWEERQPGSSMRLLQIALPGEGGPESEGELTVFYFGPSAGSIQMNIERWIGQFTQPDSSDSKTKAKIVEEKGDGHPYTLVDLSGTMAASSMMGAPATPERPGWRLLASIITTPSGPWFIKATGPDATMTKWREEFMKVNQSVK